MDDGVWLGLQAHHMVDQLLACEKQRMHLPNQAFRSLRLPPAMAYKVPAQTTQSLQSFLSTKRHSRCPRSTRMKEKRFGSAAWLSCVSAPTLPLLRLSSTVTAWPCSSLCGCSISIVNRFTWRCRATLCASSSPLTAAAWRGCR